MADYASELLTAPASKPLPSDYAGELLGGNAPRAPGLSDLEISPGKPASFATLSKAAMVDDPQTKLRIFAKDRFGDENAADRYGIVDGDVLYAGDDGNIYQETPDGFSGWAKETAAGFVGKSPTIAGGVLGGIAGAPLGIIGAVPGAWAGAMGGEGVRKSVANLAFEEPQTSLGNFKAMAGEGAYAGMGELFGAGFASALERNLVRDIKRLDRPGMAALEGKAKKAGVDLFPAQVTNLRSIKGKHETLGRMDASADIIAEGSLKQAEQANAAAYRYFGSLGKTGDPSEAARQGAEAAQSVVSQLERERSGMAAPFYKRAFQKSVETTPELAALADTPIMQQALSTAKRLAANEGIKLSDPKNTMLGLHWTKMALDNMIEGAGQQGIGGVERRQMIEMKHKLLDFMDKADVNYGLGRYFYAGESEGVTRAQTGMVGELADKEKDITRLVRGMFSPTRDPAEIRNAKRLFERGRKTEEWDSLVRSYLQDAFEHAGRFEDGITSQAPRFRKQMIGNPRQKEILKSALHPDQYEALLDLSDVFEAIGRVNGYGGSPTMPLQEGAKQLRSEAGVGAIGAVLAPQRIPGRLVDWIQEARLGKHAEKMAEILTTPGDIRRLRELKKLSPNDRKFIAGTSALLGLSASPSGAEEVRNPRLDQQAPR